MASRGITDKVAVVGMGCTRFGERWDSSTEDLILEASASASIRRRTSSKSDIDAYWLGTLGSGQSGLTLSRALPADDKPVTRVENYLRHRLGGLPQRLLRGGVRCLRRGDGRRRREAQGLRVLRV